nr:hypothetical protein [Tanacetum cinerariifolium]
MIGGLVARDLSSSPVLLELPYALVSLRSALSFTTSESISTNKFIQLMEAMADSAWIEAMQEELHQFDRLQQHHNEVNEIRAKRLACTANPLVLVAQQQPDYHPQNYPYHYTQNSLTISQAAATRNRGKEILNSPPLTYDQEPTMVVQQSKIQCYNCKEYRHVAKKCQKPKMLLCKQEEAGIQLSAKQVKWRDDIDDEPNDQELEACYLYMAKIQEVSSDAADNSGHIFDTKPLKKVQNDNDNYNVFANDREHPKQPESVNDTNLEE